MTRKVKIIDAETGQQLRETYTSEPRLIFGWLTIQDAFKAASFLVAATIFFINGEIRIRGIQETQGAMTITLSRMVDFRDNADSFNTLVYKTKFKNGEPVDQNFKIPNNGNVNEGSR